MFRKTLLPLLAIGGMLSATALSAAGPAPDGATLFRQRCASCHVIAPGAKPTIGPNLNGLVGRKAASTAYAYSTALKASNLTWTRANLDRFLTAPGQMVPGTRMVISISDAQQRAAVLNFLTHPTSSVMSAAVLEDADWPLFGWADDIRPALRRALDAGHPVALATLFKVEGSAPRGAGAQMLFDGAPDILAASGYFSGDCIEADVGRHAAEVLADGVPRHLHYGMGSPWIDIRLRCGGALHILVERLAADCAAARELLANADARRQCVWSSDGEDQKALPGEGPLLSYEANPLRIARRYDPPRRLVVSGGDPGALALAKVGAEAQIETILVRPGGPEMPPPFAVSRYLRDEPAEVLAAIGLDRWTAYIGATHEDHHDLGGCLYALQNGAGYVAMIGAKVRAQGRMDALRAAGATDEELARLHLSPGIAGLGKAPWEVAIGIIAEVLQAMNPARERA